MPDIAEIDANRIATLESVLGILRLGMTHQPPDPVAWRAAALELTDAVLPPATEPNHAP